MDIIHSIIASMNKNKICIHLPYSFAIYMAQFWQVLTNPYYIQVQNNANKQVKWHKQAAYGVTDHISQDSQHISV